MIFDKNAKVLVCHRRLFDLDHPRYFVGYVEEYEDGIARVGGFTMMRDGYTGTYIRKDDERTKIISLSSGALIVYQLPSTLNVEALTMRTESQRVVLEDDTGFSMDLSEGYLHDAPSTASCRRVS